MPRESETFSRREVEDLIEALNTRQLTRAEKLFAQIARNPNYKKYSLFQRFAELSGNAENKWVLMVLERIKANGISEFILHKFNAFEVIAMGGANGYDTKESIPDRQKERAEIDLEEEEIEKD